ncbi:lanthionine synthetase C family protein [Kitasatospora sp. NPDC096077]|uniref:lanthionine synthetase C family protein n=1 Tax=Kitasatospora sp. NPDC096077 TaxID=3155544 RepID=UPI003318AD3F
MNLGEFAVAVLELDVRTTEVARAVADRLAAFAGAAGSSEQPAWPDPLKDEASLADGYPGMALALLHAGKALDEPGPIGAAQALLRRSAQATAVRPLSEAGLYNGTAGFASVLLEFAAHDRRYLPSLRRVADSFGEQIAARELPEPGEGLPLSAFDVISGAAGQLAAAVRLCTALEAAPDDPIRTAAERLTAYLLRVSAPDDRQRPGWFTPPDYYGAYPGYDEQAPHGMYNLGFAHGLPGIVSALCVAAAAGIGGSGPSEAIARGTTWLVENRLADDVPGAAWPNLLKAEEGTGLPLAPTGRRSARAAWCFGAPGIGIALLNAAGVLGDSALRETAVGALQRVVDWSPAERYIFAPNLCHGHSGLLAIYRRAHEVTGTDSFRIMAEDSLRAVLSKADEARPYVVADEPRPGELVDDPGFVNGAAGVLLALCGALAPRATGWDELFLLTPA